ncbi:MAG: hypothetical protein ACLP7P_05070 [Rhodomicrobium sp.]
MIQALPPAMQLVRIRKDAAEILSRRGLTLPFDAAELVVTSKNICEPTWSTSVSTQLFDRIFPPLGPMEVLHFTKSQVLQSILEHHELWLATVAKNFDAGEYLAFIKEHGYASASSKSIRRELSTNYFYTSFTAVGSASAESHWNVFAASGTGYCLRFHLMPRNAEVRRIRYQAGAKSLLTLIDEELKAKVSRTFLPRGVARLTAFYLQQHLAYEDEIRLLVSNPPSASKFKSGPDDYIAIDISSPCCVARLLGIDIRQENPWCGVRLLGITCGQAADVPRVQQLARRFDFSNVTIEVR